jgi:hypothetical protein
MRNVEMKVAKGILTITVDLNKTIGPSKSGKTILIGSTDGNATVVGHTEDVRVGLNVYKFPAVRG